MSMHTSFLEARPMGSTGPVGAVLILSRLLLVSQAVSAALRGRGIDAAAVEWAVGSHRAAQDLSESDVVVLFDDLEDRNSVVAAQARITESSAQFLVLTQRRAGPAWGAMLASGAAGVMSNESSLVEVHAALVLIREGRSPHTSTRRSRLIREWFRWLAEDDARRTRLSKLSLREREVLDLLSHGHPVNEIATNLTVSETTVRSHIKSILRKLDVGSQLAAVAVAHLVGDDQLRQLSHHPRDRVRWAPRHDGGGAT